MYDPLGFLAPIVLTCKQMLQQLCKENLDWDAPLPEDMVPRWKQWRNDLMSLEDLQIPRCYKQGNHGTTIIAAELHPFSDASTKGYGQCSYLRLVDSEKDVSCSFVIGKARVCPPKQTTVPRLELTTAVLSVWTSQFLKQELELDSVKELDSQPDCVVLYRE